ncbi:MAG: TonB-dependent receptor [Bacteroidales bacterium]
MTTRNCIVILAFLLLTGKASLACNPDIQKNFHPMPLSEILSALAERCQLKFAYDHDLVRSVLIDGSVDSVACGEALQTILQKTQLWYQLIGDVYVIKPESDIPPEDLSNKYPPPRSFHIKGLVREEDTREGLPYATLVIEGGHWGTTTNSDGYFSFTTGSAAPISLVVGYIGFNPKNILINPADVTGLLIIELKARYEEIGQVNIYTDPALEMIAGGIIPGQTTINAARLSEMPSISTLDVIFPLQLLPGIDGTTESVSGLMVRKLPPDKNLILYDGFPVYHIDHFFGMFSAFNSKAIKDIQVYKGGYGPSFGGRVGGVVEITGKSGDMSGPSFDAGIDLLSANALIETPLGKKSSLVFSARRSFTDLFQTNLYNSLFQNIRYDVENNNPDPPGYFNSDPDQTLFCFYDVTAKLTFRPSNLDVLSISAYRGYDKVDYQSRLTGRFALEDSDWGNMGASFRWARQWTAKYYSNLIVGLSGYHFSFFRVDSLRLENTALQLANITHREQDLSNVLSDQIINLNNQWHINKNNQLGFGFSANFVSTAFTDKYHQYLSGSVLTDTARHENIKGPSLALYIQNTYSANRVKQFMYGLRTSYYHITGKWYHEPRLSLVYEIIPGLHGKASYGRHIQFNNRIVLVDQRNCQYLWTMSDDRSMPVVLSGHVIMGLVWKPLPGITIDLEVFSKKTTGMTAVQNLLHFSETSDLQQVRKTFQYQNKTTGAEWLIKKQMGPAQLWMAYTIGKSTDQSDQVNNRVEYPAIDDQLHELKLFGIYRLKGWRFSANWIYGSGKRWDRPEPVENIALSSHKNSVQLQPYHRMDLAINKSFNFKKSTLKTAINLFNIYNRDNVLTNQFFLVDRPTASSLSNSYTLQVNEVLGGSFLFNVNLDYRF